MVAFRLDHRLQGRIDPSDVLQDAYIEASRLKVYKAVFEPKVTQDASELGVGVVFVS